MHADADVSHHPETSRYELRVDDALAGWLDYRPAGESTIIAHTEVVEGFEGRGLGGQLLAHAFADIEQRGLTIIPTCPFAVDYLHRHPEWVHLVDAAMRGPYAAG